MDDSAKKAASIRQTVISLVCGTARRMIATIKGKKAGAKAEGGEAAAGKKVLPKTKGAPATAASSNWSPW